MSDNIVDDPDGLTISFDGPHGPTQLHFSNELLTGPFVCKLREAEFGFDPLHVDKLREYLIARRDGDAVLDPSQQEDRAASIGEVRRYLCDRPLSSYRLPIVKEAAEHTRAGRLFVIENLPILVAEARLHDADDAIKRGILRPPFPSTFVLVAVDDRRAPYLLAVSDDGYVDDDHQGYGLNFWGSAAFRASDGSIGWGRLMGSGLEKRLTLLADVAISLIADPRVSAIPIKADAALNKARVKGGKAPIPPYWKIESPGPTVLVPGAPAVATKPGKGTHASPRPHDRRGHPRHLKSGRTVWVRDCKINALAPHLTRGRAYYEVRI
jgi:hypothetical protein